MTKKTPAGILPSQNIQNPPETKLPAKNPNPNSALPGKLVTDNKPKANGKIPPKMDDETMNKPKAGKPVVNPKAGGKVPVAPNGNPAASDQMAGNNAANAMTKPKPTKKPAAMTTAPMTNSGSTDDFNKGRMTKR
jgi:hypothetical protein